MNAPASGPCRGHFRWSLADSRDFSRSALASRVHALGPMQTRWVASALLSLGAAACSSATSATIDTPNPFGAGVRTVALEVDYAKGAEPYVGAEGQVSDLWRLTRDNLDALFQKKRTLTIPSALDQMEAIADVPSGDLTTDQLLDVASRHRQSKSTADAVSYYVLFVDAYLSENGQRKTDVLGVSIGHTGVVAMFKPVIRAADVRAFPGVVRFTEQAVLIHELGHAVGLVDNGLPLTSAHKDEANGAHCKNPQCVMYYANDGARDALQFARRFAQSGSTVVFGSECANDAAAALR